MKKIIKSTIILFLFTVSIISFQLSCGDPVIAQQSFEFPPATNATLGGIIVGEGLQVNQNGLLSINPNNQSRQPLNKFLYSYYNDTEERTEFWIANLDGSENYLIPITLPTGFKISQKNAVITPDGASLIFSVSEDNDTKHIYSISLDGSNLTKIVDGSGKTGTGIVYNVVQSF